MTFLNFPKMEVFTKNWSTTIRTWYEISGLLTMTAFDFITDLLCLEIVIRLETARTNGVYNFFITFLANILVDSFIEYLWGVFIEQTSAVAYYEFEFSIASGARCGLPHLIYIGWHEHQIFALLVRAAQIKALIVAFIAFYWLSCLWFVYYFRIVLNFAVLAFP